MSDQNPICWGLLCSDGVVEVVTETEQELLEYKEDNPNDAEVIIPLYRHPQPTLTDAEREAVEFFVGFHNEGYGAIEKNSDTLRKLLERMT